MSLLCPRSQERTEVWCWLSVVHSRPCGLMEVPFCSQCAGGFHPEQLLNAVTSVMCLLVLPYCIAFFSQSGHWYITVICED